ncbi:ATP-grasp domain-containing protein [Mycena rebaudengoi]|nr:ATP-grasp domain-containing protein [Mycena rebaudengoi]
MSSLPNTSSVQFTTLISLGGPSIFQARWMMNPVRRTFQTVDVTLRSPFTGGTGGENRPQNVLAHTRSEDHTPQILFLAKWIRLAANAPRSLKLIVPMVDGFLARGHFFEQRLVDCHMVEETVGFLSLSEEAKAPRFFTPISDNFLFVVSSAIAGILTPLSTSDSGLEILETELISRLSGDWLLKEAIKRRNVVLVEGYSYLQTGAGFIQAVQDFNIALIVIGAGEPNGPKHWLQNPANARGFCDAFIPIDMTVDDSLPNRIADAVRGYTGFDVVHGILTAHDSYLVSTAKAAGILGLAASPVPAHEISTNKYSLRRLEVESQTSDYQYLRFAGLEDIQQQLGSSANPLVIEYPAIIKPISGFLSEGVAKIRSDAELLESMRRIDTSRHGHSVVVETYVDGPEFDANIVLCEGNILFFELTDDFPSAGDLPGAGATATFFETSEFTPSNLPSAERDIVRTSLHKTLLTLGFTWGLFHVEGRVKDSTMVYRADESGIMDLRERLVPRKNMPSCFLVEINARIPRSWVERLKIVATPFQFPHRPDGSQYWCELVFIQPDRGGRYNTDDACGDLLRRHSKLVPNVSKHFCTYEKGDIIPDPASGVCLLLAYFLVYSRRSRQEVRELAEFIRAEFRYDII